MYVKKHYLNNIICVHLALNESQMYRQQRLTLLRDFHLFCFHPDHLLQFMISWDTNIRTVGWRRDERLRRQQELGKSRRYYMLLIKCVTNVCQVYLIYRYIHVLFNAKIQNSSLTPSFSLIFRDTSIRTSTRQELRCSGSINLLLTQLHCGTCQSLKR